MLACYRSQTCLVKREVYLLIWGYAVCHRSPSIPFSIQAVVFGSHLTVFACLSTTKKTTDMIIWHRNVRLLCSRLAIGNLFSVEIGYTDDRFVAISKRLRAKQQVTNSVAPQSQHMMIGTRTPLACNAPKAWIAIPQKRQLAHSKAS